MKKLKPRDPKNIKLVEEIIERIRRDWADESNVVQIGPGIKISGGKPLVDTLCIQYFVVRKVEKVECKARGWMLIPEEIDGVPTDVEPTQQIPHQILETRRQRFDPLIGGIVIGNQTMDSVGTLGGIVFTDNAAGTAVGLTNEHVLVYTNDGATGDPVVQPWRDYDNDVDIVDADCCPDGQLSFDRVGNPLRDGAIGAAIALAVAAAASDVIDPHRRGQKNTNVDPDERTLKEHVHMRIAYPEMPLPGTPYTTKVEWDYTRHTDKGEHKYSVTESPANPHVLGEQELITNKTTYAQGEQVYFLAALASLGKKNGCQDRHVVAHALSPSEGQSKSTILQPVSKRDWKIVSNIFAGLDLSQPLLPQHLYFGDYPWQNLPPEGIPSFMRRGFMVTGLEGALLRFTGNPAGNIAVITIPNEGIEVRLPVGAEKAGAMVHGQHSEQITLTAFDGDQEVGSQSGAGNGVTAQLEVSAPRITRVTITGGAGEGLLLLVVSARTLEGSICCWWGKTTMEPTAETGLWSTYMFVQTVNDVPDGVEPAKAAQTIGGLLISNNLVSAGRRSELPYGEFCAIDSVPNGNFEVVPPS
jgi:hypothetical protein